MRLARERTGDEDGQATVELVALLPALVAVALLAWQALLCGECWWLTHTAAREAARAQAVGADPAAAAASALPDALRRGLAVSQVAAGGVRVRVQIPAVFAGLRLGSITAGASMERQS
jgi:Flp pilus assembly pilin Flp